HERRSLPQLAYGRAARAGGTAADITKVVARIFPTWRGHDGSRRLGAATPPRRAHRGQGSPVRRCVGVRAWARRGRRRQNTTDDHRARVRVEPDLPVRVTLCDGALRFARGIYQVFGEKVWCGRDTNTGVEFKDGRGDPSRE